MFLLCSNIYRALNTASDRLDTIKLVDVHETKSRSWEHFFFFAKTSLMTIFGLTTKHKLSDQFLQGFGEFLGDLEVFVCLFFQICATFIELGCQILRLGCTANQKHSNFLSLTCSYAKTKGEKLFKKFEIFLYSF